MFNQELKSYMKVHGLYPQGKKIDSLIDDLDFLAVMQKEVEQRQIGLTSVKRDLETQRKVMTGTSHEVIFIFENPTSDEMIGQVIPSVSPGRGAEYFHKTECFCFEQQTLTAGERIELPVRFIVDPGLPKDIGSLSLGYTLFDLTKLKDEAGLVSL